ncbi:MAG: hypothetical protein R3C99_14810 [Pirellulaceae bacterium]|nr:hypothetical protein [Planctomycetales bacterium]MCA9209889.1 hypothetical protein [Planctomycetales bacterium]
MKWLVRSGLVWTLIVVLLVGCGGGGRKKPKTAPVSGTVFLDGQPAADVEVSFISDTAEFSGYGKTNSEGKYELVQGAVPGLNKITFSKVKKGSFTIDPEAGMDEEQLRAMGISNPSEAVGGETIPADYSDATKSKITYDVPDGGDEGVDFRLTSK